MGVAERCRFVQAGAEDLAPIADGSVDVVTTRSVLAYAGDKRRAFAEFARVLRPGGRISLYEPVNRLCYPEPPDRFSGYDVSAVQDLIAKVIAAYERRQPLAANPMLDFDERDLVAFAEQAGFGERHLALHVDVVPHRPQCWHTFLRTAANSLEPTLEEATRFAAHLRPLVERGDGTFAVAVAYLWAVKG